MWHSEGEWRQFLDFLWCSAVSRKLAGRDVDQGMAYLAQPCDTSIMVKGIRGKGPYLLG